MKYISYNEMKDFYTIDEVCRLFEMDKATLRHYAEKYDIRPQEDQYGNWGFRKVLVRKLHNLCLPPSILPCCRTPARMADFFTLRRSNCKTQRPRQRCGRRTSPASRWISRISCRRLKTIFARRTARSVSPSKRRRTGRRFWR